MNTQTKSPDTHKDSPTSTTATTTRGVQDGVNSILKLKDTFYSEGGIIDYFQDIFGIDFLPFGDGHSFDSLHESYKYKIGKMLTVCYFIYNQGSEELRKGKIIENLAHRIGSIGVSRFAQYRKSFEELNLQYGITEEYLQRIQLKKEA